MKMFGTLFFICSMFFLLFVVLASTPLARINRACMPAEWVGRLATTTGAAFSSGAERSLKSGSSTMYDTCRFFIFRQFYAEEWAKLREAAGRPVEQEGQKKGAGK